MVRLQVSRGLERCANVTPARHLAHHLGRVARADRDAHSLMATYILDQQDFSLTMEIYTSETAAGSDGSALPSSRSRECGMRAHVREAGPAPEISS